ncbi:hypothetical protein [Candidatus Poriferisocius sp.]|uniref:hypothetical protein n=1 Tax=Candidatus Poriferisocius sp. TaxID=3101276 RepID=UPI003B5C346D
MKVGKIKDGDVDQLRSWAESVAGKYWGTGLTTRPVLSLKEEGSIEAKGTRLPVIAVTSEGYNMLPTLVIEATPEVQDGSVVYQADGEGSLIGRLPRAGAVERTYYIVSYKETIRAETLTAVGERLLECAEHMLRNMDPFEKNADGGPVMEAIIEGRGETVGQHALPDDGVFSVSTGIA